MKSQPKPRGVMSRSVQSLVLQARGGDRDALSVLSERAAGIALRIAAVALADEHLARDVSQDVAIRALKGLGKLRAPDRFDAWVYRITVSEIRRVASRRSRRHEILMGDRTSAEDHLDGASAGEEDHLEASVGLSQALAELSERERVALALRYVNDLDDTQIARAMRCRPGTVRSLISRGRQKLRENSDLGQFRAGRCDAPPVLTPETKDL